MQQKRNRFRLLLVFTFMLHSESSQRIRTYVLLSYTVGAKIKFLYLTQGMYVGG